jgi:hypothetical protein
VRPGERCEERLGARVGRPEAARAEAARRGHGSPWVAQLGAWLTEAASIGKGGRRLRKHAGRGSGAGAGQPKQGGKGREERDKPVRKDKQEVGQRPRKILHHSAWEATIKSKI